MQKHYFLVDNVVDSPYGAISISKATGGTWFLDDMLYPFDDCNPRLFLNVNKHFLLDKTAYKFIVEFVQMPADCIIQIKNQNIINLINTDPKTYLIICSPLEFIVNKTQLFDELIKHNINYNKVIVLSNAVELHKTVDRFVKFVSFDFWEAKTRYHYRLLPNVSITTDDERLNTLPKASKKFISVNRNVKPHRAWFYYSLIKNKMLEEGHISYHLPAIDPYYKTNEFINLVLKSIPRELHDDFIQQIHRGMHLRILDKIDNKFIINHNSNLKNYYIDSCFSIVSESDYKKITISEKTFKAIMNMHPFYIIGIKDIHNYLRKKGYETFEDLFDTEEVVDYNSSCNFLNNIKNMPLDNIKKKIRKIYFEKCKHNFQHFLNSKTSWNDIMTDIFEMIGAT